MTFFAAFLDELSKIAKSVPMEEPGILFHGSPSRIKIIEPRSGVRGRKVFATPSELMAKAYLAPWDDRTFGQFVDVEGPAWSKTRMGLVEMQPGAFEKVFAGKKGHVYEFPSKGFKPFGGTHVEMVGRKSVAPVKVREIKDILRELTRDPNFRLVRFDPKSEEFKKEVLHRRKIVAGMKPRERADYERWFRRGGHPQVAEAVFSKMAAMGRRAER